MSKNITIEDRKAALTAWLNREAGNPSDFTFPIEADGFGPATYDFRVDLNGNGQCVGEFLVFTEEESHAIKVTLDRDLSARDIFKFNKVNFVIIAL